MADTEPTRRRRRWRLAVPLALVALLVLGATVWPRFSGPLSPEELALVGEWESRDDARPGARRYVSVYRPDRTVIGYYQDVGGPLVPTTATNAAPRRWRLSGGRLDTRPDGAGDRLRDAIHGVRHARPGVVELTPDGPDCYRYAAVGPGAPDPPTTGTLTRLEPAAAPVPP